MVELCERCGVSGNEVRLFDAIYDGRMSSLCERCSVIENIPIIKKPGAFQLKESEKSFGVYDRMKRLSGVAEEKEENTFFQEDKLNELDSYPELEIPEKKSLNLIDYFHWEIMKDRRKKCLSQKQLAETIGESEIAVQMLEKGKIPENPEIIIRKLEQFFQIRLRKMSEVEKIMKQKKQMIEPILLDEDGVELDVIPEPEIEDKKSSAEENIDFMLERIEDVGDEKIKGNIKKIGEETEEKSVVKLEGELDLRKTDARGVTIGQLKELHRKKIEVTRQEQLEEKKKIEERQRILQALRERDRLKIERRKREEELGKKEIEDQKQKLIEEKKQEVQLRKEQALKELDPFFGGIELINKGGEGDKSDFSKEDFDKELL